MKFHSMKPCIQEAENWNFYPKLELSKEENPKGGSEILVWKRS